jgi:hypothetical protein
VPAQTGQLALNRWIGERRASKPEFAAKPHLVDHLPALVSRNENVRAQLRRPDQKRLLRIDRELEKVFDPPRVNRDVDLNIPPANVRSADNLSCRNQLCVQERAVHAIQIGVPIGSVYDSTERRAQGHRFPSSIDLEVRSFCGALDLDAIERAREFSGRRQDSRQPCDSVEVGAGEQIRAFHGRFRRVCGVPGAKSARRFNFAFRKRIGQCRDIRHRLIHADCIHDKVVNQKLSRGLERVARVQFQHRVRRLKSVDDDPIELPPSGPVLATRILIRRNLHEQAPQSHFGNMARSRSRDQIAEGTGDGESVDRQ